MRLTDRWVMGPDIRRRKVEALPQALLATVEERESPCAPCSIGIEVRVPTWCERATVVGPARTPLQAEGMERVAPFHLVGEAKAREPDEPAGRVEERHRREAVAPRDRFDAAPHVQWNRVFGTLRPPPRRGIEVRAAPVPVVTVPAGLPGRCEFGRGKGLTWGEASREIREGAARLVLVRRAKRDGRRPTRIDDELDRDVWEDFQHDQAIGPELQRNAWIDDSPRERAPSRLEVRHDDAVAVALDQIRSPADA